MATPITLVLAEADPVERIELEVPLDAQVRLDHTVMDEWPARREMATGNTLTGTLRHDEDGGWSMRFAEAPGDPDAPIACLLTGGAPLSLGGFVSVREPDGRVRAWQIVRLG